MKSAIITLEMNTGILPIINVGMYNTSLDLNYIHEDYIQEYKEVVKDTAIDYIYEALSLLPWSFIIKDANIVSPKYYNYMNDELDFVMIMDFDDYLQICNDVVLDNGFFEWIKEEYKSCSGFISTMPTEKSKYLEALQGEDIERAISMYLVWQLSDEYLKEYQMEFINDVRDKTSYMEEDYVIANA